MSCGNTATPSGVGERRRLDAGRVPGAQPRHLVVEAGADEPAVRGEPVEHHVGRASGRGRPRPRALVGVGPLLELLHDPGEQPDRRVGQPVARGSAAGSPAASCSRTARRRTGRARSSRGLARLACSVGQLVRVARRRRSSSMLTCTPMTWSRVGPAELEGDHRRRSRRPARRSARSRAGASARPRRRAIRADVPARSRRGGRRSRSRGCDGMTRWNASAGSPPCARGSVSGPMTSRNSDDRAGPAVGEISGVASGSGERTCRK